MHCCICWESTCQDGEGWAALLCGHVFHLSCVGKALASKPNCPTCRRPANPSRGGSPFIKLYIEEGQATESQEIDLTDDEDVGALKAKLTQQDVKLSNQLHEIRRLKGEETENKQKIADLTQQSEVLIARLHERETRLQAALDDSNSLATKNNKFQKEYATMKMKLEHEKLANARLVVAIDPHLLGQSLAAQLKNMVAAGSPVPDYFQRMLETRNRALVDANTRAAKAEAARATAEAERTNETRKLKQRIEELQIELEEMKEKANSRVERGPQVERAGRIAPLDNSNAANGGGGGGDMPHSRGAPSNEAFKNSGPSSKRVGKTTIAAPADEEPAWLSDLMPDLMQSKPAAPKSAPAVEFSKKVPPAAHDKAPINKATDAPAAPRCSLREYRARMLAGEQGLPPLPLAPAVALQIPALHPQNDAPEQLEDEVEICMEDEENAALVDEYRAPLEWGRTVEEAVCRGEEEDDDLIEIISDSEGGEDATEDENRDLTASRDPFTSLPCSLENDVSRGSNGLKSNGISRPAPAPAAGVGVALLGAGPSRLGMSAAPGASFIKDRNLATTGLKDDAQYIQHGPDGKGGRLTFCRGQGGAPAPALGRQPTMAATAGVKGAGFSSLGKRAGGANQGPAKRGRPAGRGGKVSGTQPGISAFFGK